MGNILLNVILTSIKQWIKKEFNHDEPTDMHPGFISIDSF